ncbi:hypothetical protein [Rhodococcus sp. IEGM 1379]|uniref:hypothetical protein n=1 Tax=Rhodococcus sp. IEGM 1379 TaxID=3047086 RepID=UPI0024B6C1EA|nr:hypothetical protein [Rhodococcus sp. IEGM 1379]MDI9918170.1 hypothetical protein [Rhodococcus sp. IEGM 1379]
MNSQVRDEGLDTCYTTEQVSDTAAKAALPRHGRQCVRFASFISLRRSSPSPGNGSRPRLGHGGRGRRPVARHQAVLLTRQQLRTDRQKARLEAVLVDEEYVDVEVTEHVYQDLVAAYVDP